MVRLDDDLDTTALPTITEEDGDSSVRSGSTTKSKEKDEAAGFDEFLAVIGKGKDNGTSSNSTNNISAAAASAGDVAASTAGGGRQSPTNNEVNSNESSENKQRRRRKNEASVIKTH